MGTDLVTQGMLMPGISVCAVSTRRPHTARDAIRIAYGDEAMAVEADTASKVTAAIEAGKIAITSNEMLVTNPLIDVVIGPLLERSGDAVDHLEAQRVDRLGPVEGNDPQVSLTNHIELAGHLSGSHVATPVVEHRA
jgi:hypothetical protein